MKEELEIKYDCSQLSIYNHNHFICFFYIELRTVECIDEGVYPGLHVRPPQCEGSAAPRVSPGCLAPPTLPGPGPPWRPGPEVRSQ